MTKLILFKSVLMCALSYIIMLVLQYKKTQVSHPYTPTGKIIHREMYELAAAPVTTRLQTERVGVRIPTAGTDVHFPQNDHNSSGGHPVSFLMHTGVPSWG
jgi:hypothetical protein